jgi:hypothetical protein
MGHSALNIVGGEDPNLSIDCMLPSPPSFVGGQHDDSLAGLEGKLLGRVDLLEQGSQRETDRQRNDGEMEIETEARRTNLMIEERDHDPGLRLRRSWRSRGYWRSRGR